MPAHGKVFLRLFALCLAALLLPSAAPAEDAFVSFSAGELTDLEIWDNTHIAPTGELYYNRVDGLLLFVGAEYSSDVALHPRLRAVWGWPSSRCDSYYQLDVEQPVHSQDSFSFGVSLYNRSAWSLEDEESISDFGNNAHALVARIDDRDYFRRDGVTVFAQHKATPQLTLRAEYRTDRLSSLATQQSVWSLFQRDEDWRENPPLALGVLGGADTLKGDESKRMSSYVWSASYDSRDDERTDGWLARLVAEFGGHSAGGDYEFRKHFVEATKLVPITATQTLALSGLWGIGSGTDFPSHKLFHLGGRGKLRGYDYKEFAGKNIIFGRAEYRVHMTEPLDVIYYLESGEVGYGSKTEDSDSSDGHKQDAGIGFRFEAPWDGWIRVDFARAFEEDADVQLYVSLLLTH